MTFSMGKQRLTRSIETQSAPSWAPGSNDTSDMNFSYCQRLPILKMTESTTDRRLHVVFTADRFEIKMSRIK